MKVRIKIFEIFCLLIITLLVIPNEIFATGKYFTETTGGMISNNAGGNDYTERSKVVKSYLYTNSDGTITRVEYIDNNIIVETYNLSFNCITTKKIAMELELFGGFYNGANYNFIVFGQDNLEENDLAEVVRVVKYDKNWNRIDSLSVTGQNTYEIFHSGSCRMVENDDILYIDTCHTMYKYIDGKHHQANLLIKVKESNMSLYYCRSGISYINTGYVSHSFNQFIETDGKYVFTVDHGDAYPRSVVGLKTPIGGEYTDEVVDLFGINGKEGDNYTGVSVGGTALSSSNLLVVGNSIDQSKSSYYSEIYNTAYFSVCDNRNVFLVNISKDDFKKESTKITWLTNYSENEDIIVKTPQITTISENMFLIMWEETIFGHSSPRALKAVLVDEDGNQLSSIVSFNGRLSDCQPIMYNNKVTWYSTEGGKPIFYSLDVSSVENFEKYDSIPDIDISPYMFNSKYYADINPDLLAAFGYDENALKNHYLTYGIREGRSASPIFDPVFYLDTYADLKDAFGNDYIQAYYHFINYGVGEGRSASIMFDVQYYLDNNQDVAKAYKNNRTYALMHFANYGINEGRTSSMYFDVQYYLNNNQDLSNAFGTNYQAAIEHFAQYGINEGRTTSKDFSVVNYKNNYGDLKEAFGNNWKEYYKHYICYGKNENRNCK